MEQRRRWMTRRMKFFVQIEKLGKVRNHVWKTYGLNRRETDEMKDEEGVKHFLDNELKGEQGKIKREKERAKGTERDQRRKENWSNWNEVNKGKDEERKEEGENERIKERERKGKLNLQKNLQDRHKSCNWTTFCSCLDVWTRFHRGGILCERILSYESSALVNWIEIRLTM